MNLRFGPVWMFVHVRIVFEQGSAKYVVRL